MNRLTDKALLLLYSLGSCLLLQTGPVYVCFFFLAAALSALFEVCPKKPFPLLSLALYGLITLIFPQGVFFFPLWPMTIFLPSSLLPADSGLWCLWESCFSSLPLSILPLSSIIFSWESVLEDFCGTAALLMKNFLKITRKSGIMELKIICC